MLDDEIISDPDEFAIVFSEFGPRLDAIGFVASGEPSEIARTVASFILRTWVQVYDGLSEDDPVRSGCSIETGPEFVVGQ
jgi:hypothetical protein